MDSSVAVLMLAGSPLLWVLDIACPLVLPADPAPPADPEAACAPKPLTWLQGLLKPVPPPDPVLLWMGDWTGDADVRPPPIAHCCFCPD